MDKKYGYERVLDYIEQFGSITSLEAFNDLGNTRLSASIYVLKEKGYDIKSITESCKNRFGEVRYFSRYFIAGSQFEKNLKENGGV